MKSQNYTRVQVSLTTLQIGGLVALVTFLTASRCQSQGLGCQNPPPNNSPILSQLPSNFDQRPRVDTSGQIVDAHDGMLVQFGSKFYLYGAAYGLTDGWRGSTTDFTQPTNHYRCYTSTDLVNWTLAADYILKQRVNGVLVNPPAGLYFLPKVVYNAKNDEYVLWYSWWDHAYGTPYVGVAHSCSPAGPFEIYNHYAINYSHDFSILVDDNQTAYMMYTLYPSFQNYVQPMALDYLSLTGTAGSMAEGESCVLFKNISLSRYYALLGSPNERCAFCSQGSSCTVYEYANLDSRPLTVLTSYCINSPSCANTTPTIPAQQMDVSTIPTTQGNYYLWRGDLWGTGPNWVFVPSVAGDRGEDQQFWTNLVFDANGHISPFQGISRSLVLVNKSGLNWADNAQIVAYPTDGTSPVTLGTLLGSLGSLPWHANQLWTLPLSSLTIGKFYTMQLQDLYNNVATLVPNTNLINAAALDTAVAPWQFLAPYPSGSISGYVGHGGVGNYFGWFTAWTGQSTLTLTNQGTLSSTDPLRVVAYLNGTGSAVPVATESGSWDPSQTWTFSFSALTNGNSYTFEIQDTAYGNAVIPPRSGLLQLPSSGSAPAGYIYYTGSGGYFGWHTQWGW